MKVKFTLVLGFLIQCSEALACSGPGAAEAIHQAEVWGWRLWIVNLALVLAGVLLLKKLGVSFHRLTWLLLMVAAHPGWWLGARGGDCGAMRMIVSISTLILSFLILATWIGITTLRKRKSRPAIGTN